MKKLIALAAVAACGAALAVESANIVGYQTFAAEKNKYILKSVQFDGVTDTFNIKDFAGDLTGPAWDDQATFTSTAPMLQVRNGNGYTTYYFLSDGAVDPTTGDYIPGWADINGEALPDSGVEIPAGTAFWLVDQQNDASNLTTPGAVVGDATVDLTFEAGYTLAASPYPVAVAFSEISFAGLTGPAWDDQAAFTSTAPMMQVRVGSGYVTYYYLSDGAVDAATGDYIPGWADINGEALPDYTAKVISAGTAFWLVLPAGSTSVTATFSL